MKTRIAVVGAPGYSGAEVCRLLLAHPRAEIVGLFGSASRDEARQGIAEVFPRFRGRLDREVQAGSIERILGSRPEAVFLGTPHEASMHLAPALLDAGVRVLDLSGAFRLPDAGLYPAHYGFAHEHPRLLAEAVYGLVEHQRERLHGARLIAVPGCYPTSAILPLRPLARAGAIRPGSRTVVNSISGLSGAGRAVKVGSLFCEVGVQPYGVLAHRHQPEIETHAGAPVDFTPHLAPLARGIVSTIHVTLAEGWNEARAGDVLRGAYANERFVRLLPSGAWPSTLHVERTNYCDIGWAGRDGRLIMCSAIDNLVKGAAGQAVQAMNAALGWDEALGLEGL